MQPVLQSIPLMSHSQSPFHPREDIYGAQPLPFISEEDLGSHAEVLSHSLVSCVLSMSTGSSHKNYMALCNH